MSIMKKEIYSQEILLNYTFNENLDKVKLLSNMIKELKINHIEIVARGSSRNATTSFKYILESNSNIRVSFVYPSTITKYNGSLSKDTLYIAVSQGGQGADLRIVMSKAKEIGAKTIAITNDENTPLNEICVYSLYLKVNKEHAMAATKSFTSEVLVLDMLAYSILDKDLSIFNNLGSLIKNIDMNKLDDLASSISKIKNLFVITRGELLGVAQETCCKLQETCFINANSFASSDFMHGPFALVDDSFHMLVIEPVDEVKDDVNELINKVNLNNGHIYSIKNCIKNIDVSTYKYSCIFTIQLLSCLITEKLGTNPDLSRNLNKYTKTI